MKYRYIDTYGYIRIKVWSHPYHDKQGYVCEHRLVVEEKLKRYLLPIEFVHHKNGSKQDNRIENLEIFSASEHRRKHNLEDNPFKGKKHTNKYKIKMSQMKKDYWKKNSKQIEIKCSYCNLIFKRSQCHIHKDKNNFCSPECWYIFRNEKFKIQKGGRSLSV